MREGSKSRGRRRGEEEEKKRRKEESERKGENYTGNQVNQARNYLENREMREMSNCLKNSMKGLTMKKKMQPDTQDHDSRKKMLLRLRDSLGCQTWQRDKSRSSVSGKRRRQSNLQTSSWPSSCSSFTRFFDDSLQRLFRRSKSRQRSRQIVLSSLSSLVWAVVEVGCHRLQRKVSFLVYL